MRWLVFIVLSACAREPWHEYYRELKSESDVRERLDLLTLRVAQTYGVQKPELPTLRILKDQERIPVEGIAAASGRQEDEIRWINWYVPKTSEISLMPDSTLGVLAHEIAHHVQHSAGTLVMGKQKSLDAQLATLAVREGTAELLSWLTLHEGDQQPLDNWLSWHNQWREGWARYHSRSYAGMNFLQRRMFTFSYTEGSRFAFALYKRGGINAVRDANTNPPQTTRAILHPEDFRSPMDVSTDGSHGEFRVKLFIGPCLDEGTAARAASGWLRDAASEKVWSITMQSEADASELEDAINAGRCVIEGRGRDDALNVARTQATVEIKSGAPRALNPAFPQVIEHTPVYLLDTKDDIAFARETFAKRLLDVMAWDRMPNLTGSGQLLWAQGRVPWWRWTFKEKTLQIVVVRDGGQPRLVALIWKGPQMPAEISAWQEAAKVKS